MSFFSRNMLFLNEQLHPKIFSPLLTFTLLPMYTIGMDIQLVFLPHVQRSEKSHYVVTLWWIMNITLRRGSETSQSILNHSFKTLSIKSFVDETLFSILCLEPVTTYCSLYSQWTIRKLSSHGNNIFLRKLLVYR